MAEQKKRHIGNLPYSRVEAREPKLHKVRGRPMLTSIFAIMPAFDLPYDGYFLPIYEKNFVRLEPLPKKDVHALLWKVSTPLAAEEGDLALQAAKLRLETARMDMEILSNPEVYEEEAIALTSLATPIRMLRPVAPPSDIPRLYGQ